jgi:type IV pilus assembly protein PilC
MPEYVLKYADARGEIRQQTAEAISEQELRDRYTKQGFLVYSVRVRGAAGIASRVTTRRSKLNLEKFIIFNQQFVTLVRAGLPILKALDLLADRLADPKLGPYIKSVRDEVRKGSLLSEAFRSEGIFPLIYVTTVMAGEKSGSLVEVLERYITYQKLSLALRKKLLVSLMYPAVLLVLTLILVVFLITYVVPNFAELYTSMSAKLPAVTVLLITVGTQAKSYILLYLLGVAAIGTSIYLWARTPRGKDQIDQIKMHTPLFGQVWLKYQVAQFSRVLSTLLSGGIPLVQGLQTAADSLGTALLRKTLERAAQLVREGQSLSSSLVATKVFPPLSIDMIEVGESTGALPVMLSSVAEFYEEDVNTTMGAALSLVEPAIMIFMGIFVAFVLIALYLPIFSLADSIR